MAAALDHDALFKLLLTAFFAEFLELFAPELAAALDPTPLVFLDKESFSDLLDPDRREADLVVQAQLRDQPATLLIHLEHQAQADATLDRRMLRYFARFYDRYDLPIYPIALCSYPRPLRPARDRHEVRILSHTILDFRYQVLQLNTLD
jgi:predicted transposase YdaD